MARKKKKSKAKEKPKKRGVESTDTSVGFEGDSGTDSDTSPAKKNGRQGKKAKKEEKTPTAKKTPTARKGSAKKGSTKKRSAPAEQDPAEEAAAVHMATSEQVSEEAEPETIDLDIEPATDEEIAALLAEAIAAREAAPGESPAPPPIEPEAEIIDLDIDLDVEEARDLLIAEALAFVESEDAEHDTDDEVGPTLEAASEGSSRESIVPESAADRLDEDVDTTDGVPSEDSASGAPSEEQASAEDRPLIGVAAVAALTQMQKEGLVSLPGDLILDLGEATTPEQRDRLLAAAMAHSEMQEAIYRVRTDTGHVRRGKAAIASTIFVLALFLAAVPPGTAPALTQSAMLEPIVGSMAMERFPSRKPPSEPGIAQLQPRPTEPSSRTPLPAPTWSPLYRHTDTSLDCDTELPLTATCGT